MESIDSVFLHSPQFQSSSLSELLGMKLLLKLETLNPLRCFKGRGADLFVSELPTRNWTLVCASAGNFGQALAYCGRKRGLSVVVFAAATASTLKVERMRQLGAEVRLAGSDFDDAKEEAKRFSQASNSLYVEDGFEPSISEGAGTIAVELCASKNTIDYVLIPLGGGALLAGMAHWIKAKLPQTKVIGIGAVGAPIMVLSLRDRRTHVQKMLLTICCSSKMLS
jgi:threonine dehydratase